MTKGKVVKWDSYFHDGIIQADDTQKKYFVYGVDINNGKKLTVGNIVTFDFVDTGKEYPKAINVTKVGHGSAHPFIRDLEEIEDVVQSHGGVGQDYLLRNIHAMMRYFAVVEDVVNHPDLRHEFSDNLQT